MSLARLMRFTFGTLAAMCFTGWTTDAGPALAAFGASTRIPLAGCLAAFFWTMRHLRRIGIGGYIQGVSAWPARLLAETLVRVSCQRSIFLAGLGALDCWFSSCESLSIAEPVASAGSAMPRFLAVASFFRQPIADTHFFQAGGNAEAERLK